jgi:hypothetical protein
MHQMMKKATGFFLLAGVLVIAAFVYLLLPFSVGLTSGDDPASGDHDNSECSAPACQIVDPPLLTVSTSGGGITRHNVQPACEEVGRARAVTSATLLLSGGLAAMVGLLYRARRDGHSVEAVLSASE